MPATPFEHEFTVRLHDIDAAGIVFFARIMERAHDAYEALLNALGHSIAGYVEAGTLIIPIAEAHAEYRRPLRLAERIRVRVTLDGMTASAYRVRMTLLGPEDDLRAVVTMRCVAVLRASMRPTALPPDLKARLTPYLDPPADAPA